MLKLSSASIKDSSNCPECDQYNSLGTRSKSKEQVNSPTTKGN